MAAKAKKEEYLAEAERDFTLKDIRALDLADPEDSGSVNPKISLYGLRSCETLAYFLGSSVPQIV